MHTPGEEWEHDNDQHWHKCTGGDDCDAPDTKLNAENHSYDPQTYDDETAAKATLKCKVCDYQHTHSFTAGENVGGTVKYTCDTCKSTYTKTVEVASHEHTKEESWSYDTDYHWHQCTTDGCTEPEGKCDKAAHTYAKQTYADDEAAKATLKCQTCDYQHTHSFTAGSTVDGTTTYTCSVCGSSYTKTEAAPAHKHNYNTYEELDETQHNKVCANTDGLCDEERVAENHSYAGSTSGTGAPSATAVCSKCKHSHTHEWGEPDGDVYTCGTCGATYTKKTETSRPSGGSSSSSHSSSSSSHHYYYDDEDNDNSGSTSSDTSDPSTSSTTSTPSAPSVPSVTVAGNTVTDVEADENVPHTSIATLTNSLVGMLFSDEELAAIGNAPVNVTLSVKGGETSVSSADAGVVENAVSGLGLTLGQYFDITLYASVAGDRTQITETNGNITLVIDIPEDLLGENRVYSMIRVHNGEETVLEDLDKNPASITFRTDRFSTYALVYKDQADTSDTSDTSDSSDGSHKTEGSSDIMTSDVTSGAEKNPATGIGFSLIPVILLAGGAAACVAIKKISKN